ncbi:MAG: hypothetical protein ACI80S_000142 [Pseudohongiellaceae bacterium]|jgi:hypothetical protein
MSIKNYCVIYLHFHDDKNTSSGRFESRQSDRGVQAKNSSYQRERIL